MPTSAANLTVRSTSRAVTARMRWVVWACTAWVNIRTIHPVPTAPQTSDGTLAGSISCGRGSSVIMGFPSR